MYSARLPSSTPGSMILGYAYSPWDTATQVRCAKTSYAWSVATQVAVCNVRSDLELTLLTCTLQVTSDAVFINDRAVANGTAVSSVFTFNLGIVSVHEVSRQSRPLAQQLCACLLCMRALGCRRRGIQPCDASLPRRSPAVQEPTRDRTQEVEITS